MISQSAEKVVLRNFEGVITTYPEPQNYVPGRADAYFKEIYPDMDEKRSNAGIAGLMNETKFNLVPEGLQRMDLRKTYATNPEHASLKDKREKRDELKEKKFQAQITKVQNNEELVGSANAKGDAE